MKTKLILFGATGDLARKKIIPALFELYQKKLLPQNWSAVFYHRRDWDRLAFEDFVSSTVGAHKDIGAFLSRITAFRGALNKASFAELRKSLQTETKKGEKSAKLFYLSLSPEFYMDVIKLLKDAKLVTSADKILLEKPFGRNKKEAEMLQKLLLSFVNEKQVCLIDHYLAKDAIEHITKDAMRASAPVRRIEASIIENNVVGERGEFYDMAGAFLDVGQNHMLQIIATVLKETSKNNAAHEQKHKALQTISQSQIHAVGQYVGYRGETGVAAKSKIETYFKLTLQSQKKAENVEILLEAGKGFGKPYVEVAVHRGKSVKRFDFNKQKKGSLSPYAKVLSAAIKGDRSAFVSVDETLEQWRIAEDVLKSLRKTPLQMYAVGANHKTLHK